MTQSSTLRFRDLGKTLRRYYLIVLVPTIGLAAVAAMYATTRSKTYQARQTLTIREEAGGNIRGRFLDSESMKTAQETVLEIATGAQVVAAALQQAGHPQDASFDGWPRRKDIEELQSRIALTAPKGKEFGKTEIIYLSVKASSVPRAIQLTRAVGDQLIQHLQRIRVDRAQSVIKELIRSRELADQELKKAMFELAAIEAAVGADLVELRTINQSGSGSGHLLTTRIQIQQEYRDAQNRQLQSMEDQEHLQAALKNPDYLYGGTPKRILEAHPRIRRLSEGLADAQLAKSQLGGRMTDLHPKVIAASSTEQKVRNELRRELTNAVSGLKTEIDINSKLVARFKKQLDDINQRLNALSGLRINYENHEREVKKRTEILERIDNDLAEARSSQVAAKSISLLHRLDEPVGDPRPVGPGRTTIVAAGLGGGLLTGIGLAFLIAPFGIGRGRRWSDKLGGRRRSDVVQGRRTDDAGEQNANRQTRADDQQPQTEIGTPEDEDLILNSSAELSQAAQLAGQSTPVARVEAPSIEPPAPTRPLTLVESLHRISERTAE